MSKNSLRLKGASCAVKSCQASKRTHPNRKFFVFPSDQILFNVWMERCAINKEANVPSRLKVCEKHFDTFLIGKNGLLRNSVPEFYLTHPKIKLKSDVQTFVSHDTSSSQSINDSGPIPQPLKYELRNDSSEDLKTTLLKKRYIASLKIARNLTNKLKIFAKKIKYYKGQIDVLQNEIKNYPKNNSVDIEYLPNLSSAAKEFGKMILGDSTIEWPCINCVKTLQNAIKLSRGIIISDDDLHELEVNNKIEEETLKFDTSESENILDAEKLEDRLSDTNSIVMSSEHGGDIVNDDQQESLDLSLWFLVPEKYECERCNIKKDTYRQLLYHMRTHSDLKIYECERCGKEFHSRSRYCRHASNYNLENAFLCTVCGKRFKGIANLRQHQLIHRTEKKHQCPYCDKRFCHRKGLNQHVICHTGKPLACTECSSKFHYNSQLKLHIETVHKDPKSEPTKCVNQKKKYIQTPAPCEICGKIYAKGRNLHIHIKSVHNKEKPFPCSFCDKAFHAAAALKCHMQHHVNRKNCSIDPKTMESYLKYKCDECDKGFTSQHLLKNHKIIHSGVKEHICSHCSKGFAFKVQLKRHVRLVHETADPRNYICGECGKVSADLSGYNSHMLSHTGETPFHCTLCDSKFKYAKSLRIHMSGKH